MSHQLITSAHGHEQVHPQQFNRWLAVTVTRSVGTMWTAYLFAIIGLCSLPQAFVALLNGDLITGVSWLSQSFLQLVLLPVILVGQQVQNAAADRRAEADHVALSTLIELARGKGG